MSGGPQIPGLVFVGYLGGGGFGDVYQYRSLALDRMEAVKVLRSNEGADDIAERFQAEANAMARLQHRHVVRVYDAGRTAEGLPYLAMQFYPGGTMEAKAAGGRLPIVDVLRTGVQIGSALATAHTAGMLHRDIKPANILVDEYGETGLTDFGVAAQITEDTGGDDIGVSVPWSPPEMLFSATAGSEQSDVYSLAATLWHLVVGRSPFEIPGGDNSRMAMMGRVRSNPAPVTGRVDCPQSLDRLLCWAMEKDPAHRPASATQFVRELQRIEDEQRFPRTQALIAAINVGTTIAPPPVVQTPSGDGTVVRPRQGSSPVRPPADGRRDDSLAEARTALRPGGASSARADDRLPTELRPRISTIAIEKGEDPVASGSTKAWLVAVSVALVAVAMAFAVFLLARDGSNETARAQQTVDAAPPVDEPAPPPGPVKISIERSGPDVTFTWAYEEQLSDDTYRLRFGGGNVSTAEKPTVTVPAPETGQVCLSVIAVRADGSNPTRDFPDPTCG